MKSNWEMKRLADIVIFNPKEHLKKGAITKKVSMDKLLPFSKDLAGYEYCPYIGGSKFRNNDILMARITPCLENGKTAKVNILKEQEIAFGSTEFIILRALKNISDADYIYYLVTSQPVREAAIKSMEGTTGRQRVQLDVLKNYQFLAPNYQNQCKIGKFLTILDNKISINKQINDNFYA